MAGLGASQAETDELLAYGENHFQHCSIASLSWPLPDEPFVRVWEQYAHEVEESGTIEVLNPYLIQLRFPVRKGMSVRPEYLAATRKDCDSGFFECATGLGLKSPDGCAVSLHATPAGRIPIITTSTRHDFVLLVQAFTKKNEPVSIPSSMGACLVSGYNNWHRIRLLREKHRATVEQFWSEVFPGLESMKELYQDCFIILSSCSYSFVCAADLGLSTNDWLHHSLVIRREHEAAHYFTRRVFGCMRNNLLDELLADYWGITSAIGVFRPDWLLRFFGLELFPKYRVGGRLENYRGDPPLSDGAFLILQRMLMKMVENLERFDSRVCQRFERVNVQPEIFFALTSLSCDELAAEDAERVLFRVFQDSLDSRHRLWEIDQAPLLEVSGPGTVQ